MRVSNSISVVFSYYYYHRKNNHKGKNDHGKTKSDKTRRGLVLNCERDD